MNIGCNIFVNLQIISDTLAQARWKRICEPILESVHINVMIAISRFRKQQIWQRIAELTPAKNRLTVVYVAEHFLNQVA